MPMLLEYAPLWQITKPCGFVTLHLFGECLLAQGHLFDRLPYRHVYQSCVVLK